MTLAVADRAASPISADVLYTSGDYLAATGGNWHLEDSEFKAKYVDRLVARQGLKPRSVCEIGCGAGGVLAALRQRWPAETQFTGYEISPQAHELSQRFAAPNLQFALGDVFATNQTYDMALVMDVVEHVEDCFDFLRKTRAKAEYKVYHIPLEITCATAIRDMLHRGYALGHIHHYSLSTALMTLKYTGHEVIDYLLTPVGFECAKHWRTRATNLVRRCLPLTLSQRLLGGYALMALTK